MDVFISWGGERSKAVAHVLRKWLPMIVNSFKPWFSDKDIDQGARWSNEVARKLEESKVGIILTTPENMHRDWILFEAGALSKLGQSRVCVLLIDLNPSDLTGPLTQFQSRALDREGLLRVLETINKVAPENEGISEDQLKSVFDVMWPRIESDLTSAYPQQGPKVQPRTDRQLIEEILLILRDERRNLDVMEYTSRVITDTLEPFEASVIENLYGLNGKQPFGRKELAELLGISVPRLDKLEADALRKLRHPSRAGRISSTEELDEREPDPGP